MDQAFTFTLTEEEYLDFLRGQALRGKSGRGGRLWINTSIPAVILITIIFWKLYTSPLWMAALTLLALVWVLVLSPQIWEGVLRHRIGADMLKKVGIQGFQETALHFQNNRVTCEDKRRRTILYRQIRALTPGKSALVFYYEDNGVFLLPLRLFAKDEDLKGFLHAFERQWGEARKKA